MHRILFVIPGLRTGGTNSSLSALYSHIKGLYNITVYPLSGQRNAAYCFDEVLYKPSFISSAFHGKTKDEPWYRKLFFIAIKVIRALGLKFFYYDILQDYYKYMARSLEKKEDFDYIVAFEESFPTKFVSFFKNPNKIAWIHCNYNMYCSADNSEEDIYCKFKKIICVSKYTSQLFSERYPSLESKVGFIYNLINNKEIINKSMLKIEDSRFVHDAKFTLISAGRIDPVKRYTAIPGIARKLLDKGLSFKWYILGPIAEPVEYNLLCNNIRKYDVYQFVQCLGNKSNPYPYFAHSDLYVCTSESEACPMVFNEAMVLNKPVVTTNFGSSVEFVKNGVNGIVCSLDDMAKQIFELLTNPYKYKSIQNNLIGVKDFNKDIVESINKLFV